MPDGFPPADLLTSGPWKARADQRLGSYHNSLAHHGRSASGWGLENCRAKYQPVKYLASVLLKARWPAPHVEEAFQSGGDSRGPARNRASAARHVENELPPPGVAPVWRGR